MEPEVIQGRGRMVETDGGTFYVPEVVLGSMTAKIHPTTLMLYAPENVGTRFQGQEIVTGYFVRFTAPGYLDSTDWEYFATEDEVNDWLSAEGEEDDDDREEDADEEGDDGRAVRYDDDDDDGEEL